MFNKRVVLKWDAAITTFRAKDFKSPLPARDAVSTSAEHCSTLPLAVLMKKGGTLTSVERADSMADTSITAKINLVF